MHVNKRVHGAHIGHLHEERFKLRAKELGYEVFTSGTPYSRVDLILMKNYALQKVQVKTATLLDGILRFETSTKVYNKETRLRTSNSRYTAEEIDFFGVHCPELNQNFLIPIHLCEGFKMRLRYEDTEIPCINCPLAEHFYF